MADQKPPEVTPEMLEDWATAAREEAKEYPPDSRLAVRLRQLDRFSRDAAALMREKPEKVEKAPAPAAANPAPAPAR